jgi:hypothetical protein
VLPTALKALEETGAWLDDSKRQAVEFALKAALPVIQRDAVRQAARRVLLLDEMDRRKSASKGPYNDMRTSLRRLARGEPLPDFPQEETAGA